MSKKEWKIGDKVRTPISERPGTIVEIVSKNGSWGVQTRYKIVIQFPHLHCSRFSDVHIECEGSEITEVS